MVTKKRSRETFKPSAYASDDLGTLQMDKSAHGVALASEPVEFNVIHDPAISSKVDVSMLSLLKEKNVETAEFRKMKNDKLTGIDNQENLRPAAESQAKGREAWKL